MVDIVQHLSPHTDLSFLASNNLNNIIYFEVNAYDNDYYVVKAEIKCQNKKPTF